MKRARWQKRHKDRSSSERQGGRKGLEESRKLDSRELVRLVAGVTGEKVSWETSWRVSLKSSVGASVCDVLGSKEIL